MKKNVIRLVSILLVLCCVTTAFADEEFVLRNGIKFGDTIDEIVEKETTLTRKSDDSNWFVGTIAGYKDSEAGFFFDDGGKLEDMGYSFSQFGSDYKARSDVSDVYATLYKSIVRKYGSPIGNVGGNAELITGSAITRMSVMVYIVGGADGYDGDYLDYDEWIVDCAGGHVKIDLVSYYYRDSNYKYHFYVDLSYYFYTDADYEEARNEKIAARKVVDDDI